MKITPIEIRQKEFEKAFRGYEKEEVDGFLKLLSQEWEKIIDDNKELQRRLESTEREVSKLREVENSLYKAIKTAEDTGTNMIEQANKAAELHLREAQIKAEAILNESKSKSKAMMEEADEKAKEILDQLEDDVRKIEREFTYIENQKDNLLSDLKSLVNDVLEKVSRNVSKSASQDVYNRLKELKSFNYDKKNQSTISHSTQVEPKKSAIEQEVEKKPDEESSFFDKI
jgi:cell division initiation protein